MKKIAIFAILALVVATVFMSGCVEKELEATYCGPLYREYTSDAEGCDQLSDCECIHTSWGGLGSCDSCKCTEEYYVC